MYHLASIIKHIVLFTNRQVTCVYLSLSSSPVNHTKGLESNYGELKRSLLAPGFSTITHRFQLNKIMAVFEEYFL